MGRLFRFVPYYDTERIYLRLREWERCFCAIQLRNFLFFFFFQKVSLTFWLYNTMYIKRTLSPGLVVRLSGKKYPPTVLTYTPYFVHVTFFWISKKKKNDETRKNLVLRNEKRDALFTGRFLLLCRFRETKTEGGAGANSHNFFFFFWLVVKHSQNILPPPSHTHTHTHTTGQNFCQSREPERKGGGGKWARGRWRGEPPPFLPQISDPSSISLIIPPLALVFFFFYIFFWTFVLYSMYMYKYITKWNPKIFL